MASVVLCVYKWHEPSIIYVVLKRCNKHCFIQAGSMASIRIQATFNDGLDNGSTPAVAIRWPCYILLMIADATALTVWLRITVSPQFAWIHLSNLPRPHNTLGPQHTYVCSVRSLCGRQGSSFYRVCGTWRESHTITVTLVEDKQAETKTLNGCCVQLFCFDWFVLRLNAVCVHWNKSFSQTFNC